jgi:hypothetical protein
MRSSMYLVYLVQDRLSRPPEDGVGAFGIDGVDGVAVERSSVSRGVATSRRRPLGRRDYDGQDTSVVEAASWFQPPL